MGTQVRSHVGISDAHHYLSLAELHVCLPIIEPELCADYT